MKLISWNVNGIRSVLDKGFHDFIQAENPDVLCLQEIKANKEQVDINLPQYSHHFWHSAQKPGYAGTAIFSKHKPISVKYGGVLEEGETEGRIITLEFEHYFVVNVYTPNSQRGLLKLSYRQKWDAEFLKFLNNLEKKKPVIFCGDLNIAHTGKDLAHPKSNYNKNAGFTQVEIDGFTNILNAGFIDSFRHFNQESGHYSWWSYMFNARANNVGWRIDYFCVSKKIQNQLEHAFILPKVLGSDHCPVGIILKVALKSSAWSKGRAC